MKSDNEHETLEGHRRWLPRQGLGYLGIKSFPTCSTVLTIMYMAVSIVTIMLAFGLLVRPRAFGCDCERASSDKIRHSERAAQIQSTPDAAQFDERKNQGVKDAPAALGHTHI